MRSRRFWGYLAAGLVLAAASLPSCSKKKTRTVTVGMSCLSVVPSSGPAAGGTDVTISGKEFEQGVVVFFGEAEASGVAVSANGHEIVCQTPPGLPGLVDVVVWNPGDVGCRLVDSFQYVTVPPLPPCTIATICPNEGLLVGGAIVTITGNDFADPFRVFFGANESPQVTFVSDQEIIAEAPPGGASGPADVMIDNTAGASCSAAAGYAYRASNLAPDLYEFNDNLVSCFAAALPFSEPFLNIHGSVDEDFFCFSVSVGMSATITMTPDAWAGNLDLELYDVSSGTLIDGSYQPSGPETLMTPPVTTGSVEFAARVFGVCGQVGGYSLNITN